MGWMILLTIAVLVPWTFVPAISIPIIVGSLGLVLLLPIIMILDAINDPVRKFRAAFQAGPRGITSLSVLQYGR
jgi:hypothetical protein